MLVLEIIELVNVMQESGTAYKPSSPSFGKRVTEITVICITRSAKEAKKYGLSDGVIMNPMKALQPIPASVR
jgi:hypothetical protein